MRRISSLPGNLAPWFRISETGAAVCKKCGTEFRGRESTELALAKHVSIHAGRRRPNGDTIPSVPNLMPQKIPPKDCVRIGHKIERVPHGYDLRVTIRTLDRADDITNGGAQLLAWMYLGKDLERRGVNLYDALISAPDSEADAG